MTKKVGFTEVTKEISDGKTVVLICFIKKKDEVS